MDEILNIVFSYEKVRDYLDKNPDDKDKIIDIIKEIKGDYSTKVVGFASKFIDKTFKRLYDGFELDLPKNFDIKEYQKKYHLILVPNHQSHADYIALQYILYKHGKIPVYIAAGVNLNIFPVGNLFRKSGAFFIRRRFDEEIYKVTFQAYIYYLLKTDKVVEFFFEGGRTRTGKLLPPKYGLFSMLLDAYKKFDDPKPLMFIPVSIAHEMIPEEKAHAKELAGKKKQKESSSQLFGIFKLFNKKLGQVHIKFGDGIIVSDYDDLKEKTQSLAFECFRAVGKGMPVTPTSLISLILLDDTKGAITWRRILKKATEVINYCEYMSIPTTKNLSLELLEDSLKVAMDMFINNKKIKLVKREKLNQVFYVVCSESRAHLLYHKNMILHHFIVPGIINATWFNIINGNINSEQELLKYQLTKRRELKHEFYLPTVKEMIEETLKVIEYGSGVKCESLAEALALDAPILYKLARKVSPFATALNYIYEGYYVSALTLKYLDGVDFTEEHFISIAKELFDMEIEHGRVVRYSETFSVPKIKTTLKFFSDKGILTKENNTYKFADVSQVDFFIEKFADDVHDQVSVNLKFIDDN